MWTDDRTALLRKLWGEGHSAAVIARRLGDVSRNAVIGKVRRLGLPQRQTRCAAEFGASKQHERALIDRVRALMPTAAIGKARRETPPTRAAEPPAPLPPEPQGADQPPADVAARILALAQHECRWPFGDPKAPGFAFCGAVRPRDDSAYCAHHTREARQPRTAQRAS